MNRDESSQSNSNHLARLTPEPTETVPTTVVEWTRQAHSTGSSTATIGLFAMLDCFDYLDLFDSHNCTGVLWYSTILFFGYQYFGKRVTIPHDDMGWVMRPVWWQICPCSFAWTKVPQRFLIVTLQVVVRDGHGTPPCQHCRLQMLGVVAERRQQEL